MSTFPEQLKELTDLTGLKAVEKFAAELLGRIMQASKAATADARGLSREDKAEQLAHAGGIDSARTLVKTLLTEFRQSVGPQDEEAGNLEDTAFVLQDELGRIHGDTLRYAGAWALDQLPRNTTSGLYFDRFGTDYLGETYHKFSDEFNATANESRWISILIAFCGLGSAQP